MKKIMLGFLVIVVIALVGGTYFYNNKLDASTVNPLSEKEVEKLVEEKLKDEVKLEKFIEHETGLKFAFFSLDNYGVHGKLGVMVFDERYKFLQLVYGKEAFQAGAVTFEDKSYIYVAGRNSKEEIEKIQVQPSSVEYANYVLFPKKGNSFVAVVESSQPLNESTKLKLTIYGPKGKDITYKYY